MSIYMYIYKPSGVVRYRKLVQKGGACKERLLIPCESISNFVCVILKVRLSQTASAMGPMVSGLLQAVSTALVNEIVPIHTVSSLGPQPS